MPSFKRTATETTRTTTSPPSTEATAAMGSAPENYFKFTDKHQRYLVKEARRHASALVVDALYDRSKWQFRGDLPATSALSDSADLHSTATAVIPPAQRPLEVFELRDSAVARVACVAPRLAADPQQLALRSHSLLARTRVRGSLDEFMGWMATRRRAVYQGLMHTLHDGHVQHADVFSGFDAEREQYALKYFIMEPTASASAALEALRPTGVSTAASASSTSQASGATHSKLSATKRKLNFLRRKGSSDSQDLTQIQQSQSAALHHQTTASSSSSSSTTSSAEGRVHFCVGEYATVRPGVARPDIAGADEIADKRIGIISYHSVEDPELLQLCNSVAKKTTPKSVRHCTSRTLLQFSGIVAYPVASDHDDGADYLEVIIKVSCFDARGLTAERRATMLHFIAGFRNLSHMMLVMRLRASPFLTATNWVADARRKCCLVCHQRFSSLRRRHHCRLCGEVTCAKCSAVHQVRLVKEAKASLRICLFCVQGVEKPKWKEQAPEDEIVDAKPQQDEGDQAQDDVAEELATRETEPIHLLNFSFAKELSRPRSPTSTVTDSSSPEERLLQSNSQSLSSSTESDSTLDSSIRDFHDSAFQLPTLPANTKPKRGLRAEDLVSLEESSVESDGDQEEETFDPEPRSISPVDGSVQPLQNFQDLEEDAGYGQTESSIRRISSLGDGDDDEEEEEEDEDDARLHALAAYGLLETDNLVDGVMPEDFALQTIVKEAAQALDCAIAAIGFVDTSRDMVSAAYSASPLCQVPRGVLPKQYSLTWEVMQRCQRGLDGNNAMPHVVVLDASKDSELKRNPFVVDTPFVRFMVGIPIRAWNGVVVGAMMIADIQPRAEVTADELQKLMGHAALAETWLENKRSEIASIRKSVRGTSRAEQLHNRLAEMLNTSYKTTLELQIRGVQMKQQVSSIPPQTTPRAATTPKKTAHPILHVLF